MKIRNEDIQKAYTYGGKYVFALLTDKPLFLIDLTKPAKTAGNKLHPSLSESKWVSLADCKRAVDKLEGGTLDQNGTYLVYDKWGELQQERVQPRTDHKSNADKYLSNDEPEEPKPSKTSNKQVNVKGVLVDDTTDFSRI